MIVRIIYFLIVILFTIVLDSNAKIVFWSVKPVYETIKPYSNSLYLCQFNGKWGVIDADGRTILPNQYDFITSQRNGIGLFGIIEGNKNRLNGFIRSDGTCTSIDGKYYVVSSFPFFSEGKLCVSDSSGKQGFMNENGNIVIKCQFDIVRPFKEGLASIKKGPWVYYIRENYDVDPNQYVVYTEWRNGQITEGTSFRNGEAVVGYGGKYMVIDMQGHVLRNFSASKWKVNPLDYTIVYNDVDLKDEVESFTPQYSSIETFSIDGKYGFRLDGKVIFSTVFDNVSLVDLNQNSIVTYKGKTGLLKIIDGDIESSLLFNGHTAEHINIGTNGDVHKLQYVISLPKQYVGNIRLLVDNGNGGFEDVSLLVTVDENRLVYDFCPKIGNKDKTKKLKCRLLYEGMEILNEEFILPVERSIRLRLSEPFVTTAQADIKTEIQEVSATIYNDSDHDVTVTATLFVNCHSNKAVSRSYDMTLPGKSSRSINVAVRVKTDENVSAVIKLSSGEQKKSIVALKIY